jgi:transcriptional regulator with XRE-family HTH domain
MADDLRERILSWRTEHHVSQAGFARLSGLSRGTIRNIEQGATVPTRANANAILSVINGEPATWSETVRERRTSLGLSQAALAEMAGVSRETVQNIEGARPGSRPDVTPSDKTRLAIDAALERPGSDARSPWQCPACDAWLAPWVDEHRCDDTATEPAS